MRKKILVLMGGRSSEHDVSLASGRQVVVNLDPKKYEVLPIIICKDGKKWLPTSKEELLFADTTLRDNPQNKEIIIVNDNRGFDIQKNNYVDDSTIIFLALHGKYGEDGTIQGMLDLMGVKYTGSGVLASALGMNKYKFRLLLENQNIKIPKYVVSSRDYAVKDIENKLNYPMFVKPNEGGSSVGASIARNRNELVKTIKEAFKYDELVLVDEFLKGKELTCAVIGNNKPQALPVVEIKPLKGEFFDYKSKYTESGSNEIVPAEIPDKVRDEIQKIALKVYKIVGCRGFGRVDFILVDDIPYVLEINTIPGLTPMSLLPKAAKAYGISYSKLLDIIIENAE